jgi:hypothetical protein
MCGTKEQEKVASYPGHSQNPTQSNNMGAQERCAPMLLLLHHRGKKNSAHERCALFFLPRTEALFRVLAMSGLRRGELCPVLLPRT